MGTPRAFSLDKKFFFLVTCQLLLARAWKEGSTSRRESASHRKRDCRQGNATGRHAVTAASGSNVAAGR